MVVVLLVEVVGHNPSPGSQSGMSSCAGHCFASKLLLGCCVMLILRLVPFSHATEHKLNTKAQPVCASGVADAVGSVVLVRDSVRVLA